MYGSAHGQKNENKSISCVVPTAWNRTRKNVLKKKLFYFNCNNNFKMLGRYLTHNQIHEANL